MATRIQEGGGGMGSSGGFRVKAARVVGGITGRGANNVTPAFRETGNSVKIVKPGTKPLTYPSNPMTVGDRPYSDTRRMRGTHPGYKP